MEGCVRPSASFPFKVCASQGIAPFTIQDEAFEFLPAPVLPSGVRLFRRIAPHSPNAESVLPKRLRPHPTCPFFEPNDRFFFNLF